MMTNVVTVSHYSHSHSHCHRHLQSQVFRKWNNFSLHFFSVYWYGAVSSAPWYIQDNTQIFYCFCIKLRHYGEKRLIWHSIGRSQQRRNKYGIICRCEPPNRAEWLGLTVCKLVFIKMSQDVTSQNYTNLFMSNYYSKEGTILPNVKC